MRLFGKDVSKKVRSDLIGRLGMIILAGVLLTIAGACSFAWFARNNTSTSSGMGVVVHTDEYDILVDRTTEFDSGYDIIASSGNVRVKDVLASANYSLSATSTDVSPLIAYELVNEYLYDGQYNMMPGAYGTLTFYLRPADSNPISLTFNLHLGGYSLERDEQDNEIISPITSPVVLRLLRGHLLFFTERSGANSENYVYDGFITSGSFVYDTSDHQKCQDAGKTDCYKIVLYWYWPYTYYDIVENISDENVTRTLPEELEDYLENESYFFTSIRANADENEKADAYNDADQTIGNGADSIVVYITVS